MSDIVFQNPNNNNFSEHFLNVMIHYKSYEDMLHWKDKPIQQICREMNLRTKNDINDMLEQIAIDRTMNSSKVEETIAKVIEEQLCNTLKSINLSK